MQNLILDNVWARNSKGFPILAKKVVFLINGNDPYSNDSYAFYLCNRLIDKEYTAISSSIKEDLYSNAYPFINFFIFYPWKTMEEYEYFKENNTFIIPVYLKNLSYKADTSSTLTKDISKYFFYFEASLDSFANLYSLVRITLKNLFKKED